MKYSRTIVEQSSAEPLPLLSRENYSAYNTPYRLHGSRQHRFSTTRTHRFGTRSSGEEAGRYRSHPTTFRLRSIIGFTRCPSAWNGCGRALWSEDPRGRRGACDLRFGIGSGNVYQRVEEVESRCRASHSKALRMTSAQHSLPRGRFSDDDIVISGMGVVSALGIGVDAHLAALKNGRSALKASSSFARWGLGASHRGLAPHHLGVLAASSGRAVKLAGLALREALGSSGFEHRYQVKSRNLPLILGTTAGGMLEAETVLAEWALGESITEGRKAGLAAYPLGVVGDRLREQFALRSSLTICAACASGTSAIRRGTSWIQSGRGEMCIVGGYDALCALTSVGFSSLGATIQSRMAPFDLTRAGLNLGEGAAVFILEKGSSARRRNAPVFAVLRGVAEGSEAYHVTHPEPEGHRAFEVIQRVLSESQTDITELGALSLHATGTSHNDEMEIQLVGARMAEAKPKLAAPKGLTGHTLGGAGAIEACLAILTLSSGYHPVAMGVRRSYAEGLAAAKRKVPVSTVLSNSFGFGGANASLLLANSSALSKNTSRNSRRQQKKRVFVEAQQLVGPVGLLADSEALSYLRPASSHEDCVPHVEHLLDPERIRRLGEPVLWSLAVADTLCERVGLKREADAFRGLPILWGTAFGCAERTAKYLGRVLSKGAKWAPPAEFPQLVPSAIGAALSLYLGSRGHAWSLQDLRFSFELALESAFDDLVLGRYERCLIGASDQETPVVRELLSDAFALSHRQVDGAYAMLLSTSDEVHPGRQVLAELLDCGDASELKRLGAPGLFDMRVQPSHLEFAVDQQLTQMGWGKVECVSPELLGPDTIAGGALFAVAAAMCARRRAERVLVLHSFRSQLRWSLLGTV